MAKFFRCWVIVDGTQPTAFRSRDAEDLIPTLKQLQRTQPDVTLMWFERGRLWRSPEDAQRALIERRRTPSGRGREWRPGGEHKDPKARPQVPRDEKRALFKKRLIAKKTHGGGFPSSGDGQRSSPGSSSGERRPPSDRSQSGRSPSGRPPSERQPSGRPPSGRPPGPPADRRGPSGPPSARRPPSGSPSSWRPSAPPSSRRPPSGGPSSRRPPSGSPPIGRPGPGASRRPPSGPPSSRRPPAGRPGPSRSPGRPPRRRNDK
jgi:hypothetical protein